MPSYLPVLILTLVAIVVPLAMVTSSYVLGAKVGGDIKNQPYECGVETMGDAHQGIAVKFYKIAIFFLLLDVEAALLFPWAVVFREKLATWGIGFLAFELMVFMFILLAGFFYAWKKGALEWE